MTLPPLLTLSFWFDPNPPPFIPVVNTGLLILLFVCIAFAVAAYIYRRKSGFDKLTRQAIGRLARLALIFGLVGLLLYAFAYERVSYLSMRFWWIPLILWAGWEKWRLYRFFFKKIPEIRKALAEREAFEKWLPKRKK